MALGTTLKLLALDDVLIGLDHANRQPVLDVLRKHFKLTLTNGLHDAQALWSAVMADQVRLFPALHTAIPAQIDGERQWLIAPVSDADLATLATADLIRIQSAFAPGATSVLDGI